MPFPETYDPLALDDAQLRAYFALMDVASLLRRSVEQQLRQAAELTYVQFKVLARLGLDSPTGSLRMSELADEVVFSPSGLTYQADQLEKAGLIARGRSPEDERGVTVTITDAGRTRLTTALPGHVEVLRDLLFQPLTQKDSRVLGELLEPVLDHMRTTAQRAATPRRRRRSAPAS